MVRDQCARDRQHGTPLHLHRTDLRHGTPLHRTDLLHDTPDSIVAQYQQEYRGVVAYYQLAGKRYQFNRLKGLMERSLTQTLTLAAKLGLSVNPVYHRYRATLQTDQGPRAGLQVIVERGARSRTPAPSRHVGRSLSGAAHDGAPP